MKIYWIYDLYDKPLNHDLWFIMNISVPNIYSPITLNSFIYKHDSWNLEIVWFLITVFLNLDRALLKNPKTLPRLVLKNSPTAKLWNYLGKNNHEKKCLMYVLTFQLCEKFSGISCK